jgi:hypothetical protein
MPVNYVNIGLNSVEEYWQQLIIPSVKTFREKPSPSSAFHAALSLWQLLDWVWHDRHPGRHGHGKAFKEFRRKLLKPCPELWWLGDITNAGKHRGLDYSPTVQGAEPGLMPRANMTVGGTGGFMEFMTLELDDGSKKDVSTTLQKAVDFWRKELAAKNLPAP